ncbi:hypothetical protein ACNKHQ_04760 [Shigella flexneri]
MLTSARSRSQRRGHLVEVLNPLSCYMNVDRRPGRYAVKVDKLPHYDAVIPRIGSAITYYGMATLRQFEMLGSYRWNESVAISGARDKLQ